MLTCAAREQLVRPGLPWATPVAHMADLRAGGHYTAYAKMQDTGEWYCFDDAHVRRVDAATVQSPAAYVLFYLRRGSRLSVPPCTLTTESVSEVLPEDTDEVPDMELL